jgi:hypothetical protein
LREHHRGNAIEAVGWAVVWKAKRAVEILDRPTSDRVDIAGSLLLHVAAYLSYSKTY